MDTPFNFDEELFESESREVKIDATPFIPLDYVPGTDPPANEPNLCKHHADYLYYKDKYSEAMSVYQTILPQFSDNPVMTRDVEMCIAWCHYKLNNIDVAKQICERLLKTSTTFENVLSLFQFSNMLSNIHEDESTLIDRVKSLPGFLEITPDPMEKIK